MWSSDRRTFLKLAIGAPLAAACGFAPLYDGDRNPQEALSQISVAQISGLMGFKLRERLTSRLGTTDRVAYRLTVTLNTKSRALAINPQNEITRYSLTGTAFFDLHRLADNKRVLRNNVQAFSAYSTTASAFATSVAERDARERLANSLAEQIATRLATSVDRWQV